MCHNNILFRFQFAIIVLLHRAPRLSNGNSSTAHLGRSTWHPRVVISMILATGASITYEEACLREITPKEIGKYEETSSLLVLRECMFLFFIFSFNRIHRYLVNDPFFFFFFFSTIMIDLAFIIGEH